MTPTVTELTPGKSGSRICALHVLSSPFWPTAVLRPQVLDPKWIFKAFGQTNSKTIYLEVIVP